MVHLISGIPKNHCYTAESLCENAKEILPFVKEIFRLGFEDRPNYKKLSKFLENEKEFVEKEITTDEEDVSRK